MNLNAIIRLVIIESKENNISKESQKSALHIWTDSIVDDVYNNGE